LPASFAGATARRDEPPTVGQGDRALPDLVGELSRRITQALLRGIAAALQRSIDEDRHRLFCVECDATTETGDGWRAYLTYDDEIAVYCPDCAEWEFSDA
jgi:RNase P subunit RPR2